MFLSTSRHFTQGALRTFTALGWDGRFEETECYYSLRWPIPIMN